jgi:hypothetical protein
MRALSQIDKTTAAMLAVICLLALILGGKAITDETAVSLNGDMPRHLMNGVFFHDLLWDGLTKDLRHFTFEYFAQYPALSLGHHPLMLPVAEVPFYSVMGISIAAGRSTILFFLLTGAIAWFFLISAAYERRTAFLSSLLLVSSPMVVIFSRVAMSEIPALALVIVSAHFFYIYAQNDSSRHLAAFVVFLTLACYAKQLSVFLLPAVIAYLIIARGPRTLLSRKLIVALSTLGVLLVPLAVMTLMMSPSNVAWVTGSGGNSTAFDWLTHFLFPLQALFSHHLSMAVVVLSFVGLVGALAHRDQRAWFFISWIVFLYGMAAYIGLHDPRISIYWIPPFCLFAVSSVETFRPRRLRSLVFALLVLALGVQITVSYLQPVEYAGGYEEAARYVVERRRGATILYSSNVDTGYFVFFIRKMDPEREQIVLRANKLLATSMLDDFVEERITKSEEIYHLLDEMGTCYVVIEDTLSQSAAINLLRREVENEAFALRKRISIVSEDPRLRDVDLRVYEYLRCGPPDPDAILDMDLPLVGRSLTVRLRDLLE